MSKDSNTVATFLNKHKIFEIIQDKFDVYYEKLYKRICTSEEKKITKLDIRKFIDEIEMHICDNVEKIDFDLSKL